MDGALAGAGVNTRGASWRLRVARAFQVRSVRLEQASSKEAIVNWKAGPSAEIRLSTFSNSLIELPVLSQVWWALICWAMKASRSPPS